MRRRQGISPTYGVFWGIPIWVKRADAGKLDPCAVKGCFVGYNEEAKGYWVYWAAKRSVSIECNIYVNKDAVLEPGDVVFEGGEPSTSFPTPSEVSNPTVPNSQSMPSIDSKTAPPPAENPTANPSPIPEVPNLESTSKV